MKTIYMILGSLLLISACDNDLEQFPPNIASANSITDYTGVLNAAYYYQSGTVTPMGVMGDFRADNALMLEAPYTEFDLYGPNLTNMEDQFFGPFYTALYKSILSANNVIENSSNATHVGEAKFLRALSYFKLVQVFGDVTVNLSASPSASDVTVLARTAAANVYSNVIIPDLEDAILALDPEIVDGRASLYAAQGLLGKVYVHMGNFASAESHLAAVVNGATAAGIVLENDFANVVVDGSSEIIFATQISSSVPIEYAFATNFVGWYSGGDTKSLQPLDTDLTAAFDASSAGGGATDSRKALTIDEVNQIGTKYTGGADQDWIELRLSDVILLYAETLNENGSATTESVLDLLDPIRTRAGLTTLDHTVLTTQAAVRQAIHDERRVELAFEGHRWFDLVRTGTVDAEMGETINSDYHVFPIPISEVLVTAGIIAQNDGY